MSVSDSSSSPPSTEPNQLSRGPVFSGTHENPELSGLVGTSGKRVLVLDDAEPRVRRAGDLMGIVIALLGIIGLLFLAAYAKSTTEGVEQDVQSVSTLVSMLFLIPVVVLETLITLAIPIAVLTELALRKSWRQMLESAIALALGLVLALAFVWALRNWATASLLEGMSVRLSNTSVLTIPGYVAGLGGLLTAAGPRTRRRSASVSWNVLWFSLAFILISGQGSIPGVFIAVLLGRIAGLTVRYVSGVKSERAHGDDLVAGIRRAGFEPISIARVRHVTDEPQASLDGTDIPQDYAVHPLTMDSTTRVYAMHSLDGPRLDVVVLDGDRQLIGVIQRFWRSLRLRGIEGRSAISLRAVAERAALLNYAAQNAGVRTHKLLGLSEANDSMIMVFEHPERAIPLSGIAPEEVSDELMLESWRQLGIAHRAGLAHRGISADLLLASESLSLDPAYPALSSPKVWITGWQNGDIASATLAQRMDNAQMLAMFATLVGPERAINVAREVLPETELELVGPLLQSVVMPSHTRSALRAEKALIGRLRNALVLEVPEADVEPMSITRFGIKTVVTWAVTFIAFAVVATTIQFDQILSAITTSNPWWAVATFVLGLLTWVGAALTFVSFATARVPLIRAILVQAASSFVVLAAPAGIGPAALNLRMLTRRGVQTSLAVATVALVQVSGFVVTVLLLVILAIASGDGGTLRALPSTTVVIVIIAIVAVASIIFAIPKLRRVVLDKITPTIKQIWPRLSELLTTPSRLTMGIVGNILQTMGYVLAFDTALRAFGAEVSLIQVAIVYLVGNTVGAMAPTPGGLGAIEVALVTGLTTTAGVPAALATSAVVLFRVATYWARIPLGWLAMRFLQKRNEL